MDTIIAFGALGIFSAMGSTAAGLKMAFLFYSIVPGVIGIIMYFMLEPDDAPAPAKTQENASGAKEKNTSGIMRTVTCSRHLTKKSSTG